MPGLNDASIVQKEQRARSSEGSTTNITRAPAWDQGFRGSGERNYKFLYAGVREKYNTFINVWI